MKLTKKDARRVFWLSKQLTKEEIEMKQSWKIREYILVSQWVEILRTQDKQEAEEIMEKNNIEWNIYISKCIENNEEYIDNEIFMYEEDN